MARMIDPSELEGDELANWYRRSPADVEAEREAARQAKYDTFINSIGGGADAQVGAATDAPRSADDDLNYDPSDGRTGGGEAGDQAGGVVKARYFRPFGVPPMGAPVMEPPSGLRAAPPLDGRGVAPTGAPASGFFGQHRYLDTFQGYATDLPSPLNFVQATPTGWWELSDGRRVQSDEVERIYAEQKRRLRGQDSAEPAARLRVVDRLPDGHVPRVDQIEKGERELDPTCAPYGGWERDPNFKSYSDRTKQYETQITHAPGLDYVVRNPEQRPVKFDGCAVRDPRHPLLEAKGPGYASLLPKARQWNFYNSMSDGVLAQADRQVRAARDQRIEWHLAEPGAYQFFDDATKYYQPPIAPKLTPAR
jgi:hypothetical protein